MTRPLFQFNFRTSRTALATVPSEKPVSSEKTGASARRLIFPTLIVNWNKTLGTRFYFTRRM